MVAAALPKGGYLIDDFLRWLWWVSIFFTNILSVKLVAAFIPKDMMVGADVTCTEALSNV
jgi:hypothetical protein